MQAEALNLTREGLINVALKKIGQATILSARVNQRFLQKRELETLIEMADDLGAYGVVCAHSGTILSLLFASNDTQKIGKAYNIFREMYEMCMITYSIHSLVMIDRK